MPANLARFARFVNLTVKHRVYFTMGASFHVPGTAHSITLSAQAVCAVPGTLCPESELGVFAIR
jgi:hypothetical protein